MSMAAPAAHAVGQYSLTHHLTWPLPCRYSDAGTRGDLAGRLATTLNKSLKKAARTRLWMSGLKARDPAGFSVCALALCVGQGARNRNGSAPDDCRR
ncbi:protein of unknown function [Hyphomicrobium sp. 1Nfss2.1]